MKVKDVQHGKTTRKSFARINEILEMPNLIEVQKKSYQWFLDEGLQRGFRAIPRPSRTTPAIWSFRFLDYSMDEAPKYSVEECKARDATYASPLKVRMRLRNKETGEIKEQEIFMGDFPMMTDSGNLYHQRRGARRLSPSSSVRPASTMAGSMTRPISMLYCPQPLSHTAARGSNMRPIANDVFYVRIDKNRKIPITSFIRAIGVETDAEIQELLRRGPADRRHASTRIPPKPRTRRCLRFIRKLRPGEPPTVEIRDQP